MKNSQLSDGHSLIFIVFFFIFLIAGRNHATLKCKSGALGVMEARSWYDHQKNIKSENNPILGGFSVSEGAQYTLIF